MTVDVASTGPRPDTHVAALAGRGITKTFGPVTALDNVSFSAQYNRVLALLGDNGAGKTTLIKLLSGIMQPDSGELLMDGVVTRFKSAGQARRSGIATVFQDLAVCDLLSITRNIVLGNEPRIRLGPFGLYNSGEADRIARAALNQLGARRSIAI